MENLMETKELTHNFKVQLRLKGIQKRKRKIAIISHILGYTENIKSLEKDKFEDLASDWLENNVREIHSDVYLQYIEAKTVQYGDDVNHVMETNLPFSELNQLINLSTFKKE